MKHDPNAWRDRPMPELFDADYSAWIKSLSRERRKGEVSMAWENLGPFTHTAYSLHVGMVNTMLLAISKGKGPTTLPFDCQPEGFYHRVVDTRRMNAGVKEPQVTTPYDRLSAFSQFIYRRLTDRLAVAAGFKTGTSRSATLDDGLGDGLSEPESDDDGLGGGLEADGLDDGLDGLELALVEDDGLGDFGDGL
jgi:hypothetical protein